MGKSKQLLMNEKRFYSKFPTKKNSSNSKKLRKQHLLDKDNPFNELFYWSREVRMKDGHKCVVCGKGRKLTSHHLFSKSKYPALKYNISNGIVLCSQCHEEVHQLNDIVVIS